MESWIRMDSVRREDGDNLRVTIGTRVVCTCLFQPLYASATILPGRTGKVVESGTANHAAAKRFTGTLKSVKVLWDHA